MALTPDQIARELEGIGSNLPDDLEAAILEAANVALTDVKSRMNFKTNSPNGVRATIQAFFDKSSMTLGIKMPAHGYFQNYGVTGLKNKTNQIGVPEVVATAFGVSENYEFQFGTGRSAQNNPPHYWGIHYPGIEAKNFLQLERFLQQVTELVNQNLEL